MNGDEVKEPKPEDKTPEERDQEAYESASKGTSKYINDAFPGKSGKSGRNWKKPALILLIILVLAAAAAAAYFMLKPKNASDFTKSASSSEAQASPAPNSKTKHYDSANFSLGFDYPENWKVVDTAGTGKLTLTSTLMSLKDTSGKNFSGQILMTIRDKSQKLSEFDKGNATAVLASEKIAYTKPTELQRGNTYMSFLTYAETTASGALDGIYITGDNGYEKDQDIPGADIAKVDPVINITFQKCDDSKCSGAGKITTVALSSWDNMSETIKGVLQSLAIQ